MTIVNDNITLTREDIENAKDSDHIERLVESRIHHNLCDRMKKELANMALLDMEPQENGDVFISASVVLTTTQDMLTAMQRLATYLREKYVFSDEEIEKVLEVFEQDTKGF